MRRFSQVIGFDDAPFAREHRGNVRVVGAYYAGLRLEGVVSGFVLPEPLRSAHLIAGGIALGESRHRP